MAIGESVAVQQRQLRAVCGCGPAGGEPHLPPTYAPLGAPFLQLMPRTLDRKMSIGPMFSDVFHTRIRSCAQSHRPFGETVVMSASDGVSIWSTRGFHRHCVLESSHPQVQPATSRTLSRRRRRRHVHAKTASCFVPTTPPSYVWRSVRYCVCQAQTWYYARTVPILTYILSQTCSYPPRAYERGIGA